MRSDGLGKIRLTAAIAASGKTRAEISALAGIDKTDLSRIENGQAVNLTRDRLARLAKATGTTVGYLHGDPMVLAPEDDDELRRHGNWIDEKRRTIDALEEPNAILIASAVVKPVRSRHKEELVADRPRRSSLDVPSTFQRAGVQHVLCALGDSMIDAGIVNNDTLYATAAPETPPAGKIIACKLDGKIFVKRVISDDDRYLLRSENRRYLPIEFDPKSPEFEMIGVVIGRSGAVA
jgi:phage repressor protein C with HTH and peptisase S24 domain